MDQSHEDLMRFLKQNIKFIPETFLDKHKSASLKRNKDRYGINDFQLVGGYADFFSGDLIYVIKSTKLNVLETQQPKLKHREMEDTHNVHP